MLKETVFGRQSSWWRAAHASCVDGSIEAAITISSLDMNERRFVGPA